MLTNIPKQDMSEPSSTVTSSEDYEGPEWLFVNGIVRFAKTKTTDKGTKIWTFGVIGAGDKVWYLSYFPHGGERILEVRSLFK